MFAKPTYDASASANINFGPGQRISPVCVVLCVPECLPLFVFCRPVLCCQRKLFHTSAEEIIKTSISFNKRHTAHLSALPSN